MRSKKKKITTLLLANIYSTTDKFIYVSKVFFFLNSGFDIDR